MFGFLAAAPASADDYDGNWHYTLTPYVWLPSVSGKFALSVPPPLSNRIPGVTVDFSARPGSALSKLNYALMATGAVHKGNWSVSSDLIALSLSDHDEKVRTVTGPGGLVEIPVDTGSKVGLLDYVWTLDGGYTVSTAPM